MRSLILGGTSDTRKYIETCSDDFIITVATQYGYDTFAADFPLQTVLIRFTEETLKKFITDNQIDKIVDTTHPFAKIITQTAIGTALKMGIPYEDRMRVIGEVAEYDGSVFFETYKEAANYLKEQDFSSILLTTGSNNIEAFSDIIEKCRVRVLPYEKSIEKCRKAGVEYKNVIAMQGPFSTDFNESLMREIKADALVTKMSGDSGGLNDKIEACRRTNAACIIITGGF